MLAAIHFWWIDDFALTSFNKNILAFLIAICISWIATIFISIFIARLALLKNKYSGFISPLTLSDSDFIENIGINEFKKFRIIIFSIAFPFLISAIALFIYTMSVYKDVQLQKYGVIKTIIAKEIIYDIKDNSYLYFSYDYKGRKYYKNLSFPENRKKDTVQIVFSKNNPHIVEIK